MNEVSTVESPTRLIPLSEWPRHHVWPTPNALRVYVYNQDANGFRRFGVVKRVGRRILIDESAFFRWVDAQPGNSPRRDRGLA